jgi:orotidine-5'-phosphate decarboxylase
MSPSSEKIILALDVDSFEAAEAMVKKLRGVIGIYKVGKQLFTRCGPRVIEMIHAHRGRAFLDLKFHDIPNTVGRAVEEACKHGVFMLTLHALGGKKMIAQAVTVAATFSRDTSSPPPLILAVTVLTSMAQEDLQEVGIDGPVESAVSRLATLAKQAGAGGVVASAREAPLIRAACGETFVIVTPGIRPRGAAAGDQKRTVTPAEALAAGADYLVIGRPILEAADPVRAAREIAAEVAEAEIEIKK